MNKENTLLILWVIFGFIFITAVDSILYLFIHLTYFGLSKIRIPYNVLRFIVPIITLTSYILVTTTLLKKLNIKSKNNGIYLAEFPKRIFLIMVLIAIFLNPITNKLSGLFAEYNYVNQNENAAEFIDYYGWMYLGIGLSRWIVIIALAYIYLNRYKKDIINNNPQG